MTNWEAHSPHGTGGLEARRTKGTYYALKRIHLVEAGTITIGTNLRVYFLLRVARETREKRFKL